MPKDSSNSKPVTPSKAKSNILGMPKTLETALHEMNSRAVFIRDFAEVALIPTIDHPQIITYSRNAFTRGLFSNYKVEKASVANVWMDWPERLDVIKPSYEPGEPPITPSGYVNTWVPSKCKPAKGDITHWNWYMDHLFKSDPTYKEWFIRWLAYPLQHPGTKLHTACVFWSTETGTGKSLLGLIMQVLYGEHNAEVVQEGDLHSDWNPWADGNQFIMGEEIKGDKGRKIADLLKSMVTRRTVIVNRKGIPQYTVRDCANYYFNSNHPEAFYIEETDRRFFVHELGGEKFGADFYQTTFEPWLNNGGYEAILYHLLNDVNLQTPVVGGDPRSLKPARFNPGAAAPQSHARKAMIEANHDELEVWMADLASTPANILCGNTWTLATAEELFNLFITAYPRAKTTQKSFTTQLRRILKMARGGNRISLSDGRRLYLYEIGPHRAYEGVAESVLASAYEGER